MKRLCLSILSLFYISLGMGNLASAEKLTVVADEWPPFSGVGLPNGGISLDVITTVLTKAGYEVKAKVLPWARIMNGVPSGQFDVIGKLFTDARLEKFLTYSQPFYQTEVKFIRRKGSTHSFTDLDSLQPYSIAVGDGFLYEENFDNVDFLNKIVITTTLQGIQMVAHGRVDLTLDSVDVLDYSIRTNDDPTLGDKVEYLPRVLTTRGIHMAVSHTLENSEKIVDDFNRVLAQMNADGSLADLLKKHRVQ